MAVYEHTYKQYAGPLTPEWSRFLIIPRHAFRDVFKSKLFTAFFAICFVPLLVEASAENMAYLQVKKEKMGHLIDEEPESLGLRAVRGVSAGTVCLKSPHQEEL